MTVQSAFALPATVYVIDDDKAVRESVCMLLGSVGLQAAPFHSPQQFLKDFRLDTPSCIILDMRMPEMSGLEVLARLRQRLVTAPVIMVTGYGDVAAAVRALKLGAVEFLEKPVNDEVLLERVQQWIDVDRHLRGVESECARIRARLHSLSRRESEVLDGIIDGLTSKEIARRLGIGPKAVEVYRRNVMAKMAAESLAALIRQVTSCPRSIGPMECPGGCAKATLAVWMTQPSRAPPGPATGPRP